MAGQTDGIAAAAHVLRDDSARGRHGAAERDDGTEDLVVVGAGIGACAGAWLYRRHAGRSVRVLVLDSSRGRWPRAPQRIVSRSGAGSLGYGGSQSLDTPGLFISRREEPDRRRRHRPLAVQGRVLRQQLAQASRSRQRCRLLWRRGRGESRLVERGKGETPADGLPRTPLPPAARPAERAGGRAGHGCRLHWRPLRAPSTSAGDSCAAPGAYDGGRRLHHARWYRRGRRQEPRCGRRTAGFSGLDLGDTVDARMSPSGRQLKAGEDDYIYHFPDGNHGVVRALLRAMRPELLPGQGMETLSSSPLVEAALDDPATDLGVACAAPGWSAPLVAASARSRFAPTPVAAGGGRAPGDAAAGV